MYLTFQMYTTNNMMYKMLQIIWMWTECKFYFHLSETHAKVNYTHPFYIHVCRVRHTLIGWQLKKWHAKQSERKSNTAT